MIERICAHIHNDFTSRDTAVPGEYTIEGGLLQADVGLADGQFYRLDGSLFNDGIHQWPDPLLRDETFTGTIWPMRVPPALVALAAEIEAWQAQYGEVMASPYTSESVIGAYSYTKGQTGGVGGADAWQAVFKSRLNQWRRL